MRVLRVAGGLARRIASITLGNIQINSPSELGGYTKTLGFGAINRRLARFSGIDGDDATSAFNAELQDTLGAIAKKLGPIVIKYVQDNGFTMLLDNTGQQGGLSVLWTQPGTTDISQAVVDAYNVSSGVAAPVASAPSAPAPARPHPAAAAAPQK